MKISYIERHTKEETLSNGKKLFTTLKEIPRSEEVGYVKDKKHIRLIKHMLETASAVHIKKGFGIEFIMGSAKNIQEYS
jgi:hypothetical protein|tara:strand:+ start:681 stop:917 length:237 start_codon:yes stop_codon:yes gene_type:complete